MAYGKLGLIYSNEFEDRISRGKLDVYDVVYTRDTHENYIINENLEPIRVASRIFTFDSFLSAEKELNAASTTYVGQIVAVSDGTKYSGYIVNQNASGQFYLTSLAALDSIDYNSLGSRPIINLNGTLDEIVYVDVLDDGTYSIDGIYKISGLDVTTYSVSVPSIFMVEHEEDVTYIKKISAREIVDYTVSATSIASSTVATTKYLAEQGYTTVDYIDQKLALDYVTKTEVAEYVQGITEDYIDSILDEKIDEKLDERLGYMSNDQIESLFVTS